MLPVNVDSSIFGVGVAEASPRTVSPIVQDKLEENVDILLAVVYQAFADPSLLTAQDFDDTINALIELQKLVKDGIVDADGNVQRLNVHQVQELNLVFAAFKGMGIGPHVSLLSLDDATKVSMLAEIAKTGTVDEKGEIQNSVLASSLSMLSELKQITNVSVAIASLMFDEVFPLAEISFNELYDALELTTQVTKALNVVLRISGQSEPVPNWDFTAEDRNNLAGTDGKSPCSASIPPLAVDDLADYLNRITNNNMGTLFKNAYSNDYETARHYVKDAYPNDPTAGSNPELIKAEMQRLDENGKPVYHEAADILHHVIYEQKDDGELKHDAKRPDEMLDIIYASTTKDIPSIPKMTSAEAIKSGKDLEKTMKDLDVLIGKLVDVEADPSVIDPLRKLQADLKKVYSSVKATPGTDAFYEEFARNWVKAYLDPKDTSLKQNLDAAISAFSGLETKQQTQLKMLMTEMSEFMKVIMSIQKMVSDSTKEFLKGTR